MSSCVLELVTHHPNWTSPLLSVTCSVQAFTAFHFNDWKRLHDSSHLNSFCTLMQDVIMLASHHCPKPFKRSSKIKLNSDWVIENLGVHIKIIFLEFPHIKEQTSNTLVVWTTKKKKDPSMATFSIKNVHVIKVIFLINQNVLVILVLRIPLWVLLYFINVEYNA